jgi:hypothetical protein
LSEAGRSILSKMGLLTKLVSSVQTNFVRDGEIGLVRNGTSDKIDLERPNQFCRRGDFRQNNKLVSGGQTNFVRYTAFGRVGLICRIEILSGNRRGTGELDSTSWLDPIVSTNRLTPAELGLGPCLDPTQSKSRFRQNWI